MASYQRFYDDNYKNWLKTAEGLSILRSRLQNFVENETETYHKSLKENLKGENCESKCDFKKSPKQPTLCGKCERWKNGILSSHTAKGPMVHWNNCIPHLWPKEKWEVAKVFMPRGQRDHQKFEQFDISAILNLMVHCKHFKGFNKNLLTKIIQVRNRVMHSPDLRLPKEVMDEGIKNVLEFSKILEPKAQELKTIAEEIKKFNSVLEQYPPIVAQGPADDKDARDDARDIKLLEREQQALKERIEFLAQHYQHEDQHGDIKEELQGMKNFLDQNKDLLANLGPQVARLDEIQEKVEQHEQRIDELDDRVDQLEKETQDPMFSDDTLKFKNHLLEESRRRNWPLPIFTEELESTGYRGLVEVNGVHFTGKQVFKGKRTAHQEVAKIALDYLKSLPVSKEELSTSAPIPPSTSTTSSVPLFYGSVTVDFNQEVTSEGYLKEEEATESAYKKLSNKFGLNASDKDSTFKIAVLEHFTRNKFSPPSECFDSQDDKFFCKLKLSGYLTFHDKEGSTKKKQAEQQAAKVALQQLAGVLNFSFGDGGENYKGLLKERLEALNMESPSYSCSDGKIMEREELNIPCTSGVYLHVSSTETVGQASSSNATVKISDTRNPGNANTKLTQNQESIAPSPPSKKSKVEDAEINDILELYHLMSSVTVEEITTTQNFSCDIHIHLEKFTFQNKNTYNSKKDALRKTYHSLGNLLGIFTPNADDSMATMKVKQDFSQKSLPHPGEVIEGDKAPFHCSLTNITYNMVYKGEGSTEAAAKQEALQKALNTIPLLFGYKALPKSESAEENETQINTLLTKANQKVLICSVKGPLYKMAVDLLFKEYTLKAKSQGKKKENRNYLSERLLGLLGLSTESNTSSSRNCLDEWFKQNKLEQPVFEDLEEAQGSKVTFTVKLSCTYPSWEKSAEDAKQRLIQELRDRFQNLTE